MSHFEMELSSILKKLENTKVPDSLASRTVEEKSAACFKMPIAVELLKSLEERARD